MLKKIFARKPSQSAKPRSEQERPKHKASAISPTTVEHWQAAIDNASDNKTLKMHLSGLTEKITDGSIDRDAAISVLTGLPKLMLQIDLDGTPERVSDEDWKALVTLGFSAKVRKYAAANITERQVLVELSKQTKGKDKAVYRILHDSLERLQQAQKAEQAQVEKEQSVLDAMLKHADSPFEPMYEAKLKGLIEQWRTIAATADHDASFKAAQKQAEEKVVSAKAQVEQQAKQQEALQMADADRQALVDRLVEHMLESLDNLTTDEERAKTEQHLISDIQHQWSTADAHSKASKEENQAFLKASTAFEVGLAKIRQILHRYGSIDEISQQLNSGVGELDSLLHELDDWLHDIEFVLIKRIPASVKTIQQALGKYQQSLEEHRKQEIDKVRMLRAQLRRCKSAIEDGSLRRASGLYHGAEEMLKDFELKAHPGVSKQLEETTEALEKLRDWQSYAVLPKKEALIKKMSALVEQSIDPESRAQTIRDMQDEWKLLSRGLQNRQQDLWETFHDLAQKAYEPCREFFSEQRHLREVNLSKRKEVVEQLQQYAELINWEHPDVRELDRVLQVARNDWRKYSPVDRAASRGIQKEFDALHQKMFDRMRKEQSVFKEAKQALIAEAKKLLVLEDVREATDAAKKLQQRWKTAGMVARKDEHQLWQEFREVCDQLFERRDAQNKAFKADLDANKSQAEALINSIESLVQSESILAERSVFEQLKQEYSALGTLPKAHYKQLSQKFQSACAAFDKACRLAESRLADARWLSLFEWVKAVRVGDLGDSEALERWAALKVPEQATKLIEAAESWRQPADSATLELLRERTVDLEIVTGAESPAEDSELRMALQVKRLSDGIGVSLTEQVLHGLVVEWLSVGAVAAEDYLKLEARMLAARERWLR